MLQTIFNIFNLVPTKVTDFYTWFEELLINNEKSEEIKVKKRIMVYHFTVMLIYFLLLPILNPHGSVKTTIFHVFLATLNFLILRHGQYNYIVIHFIFSYLLGLYVAALKFQNFLKILGLALIQHNHSFLVHDNKFFKPICIIFTFLIVNRAQTQLSSLIENNDVEKIIEIVKGIQQTWLPLYLFNQLCAMHFAKNYCKVLDENRAAYLNLEATNKELSTTNEKLKSTLCLLETKNHELNEAIQNRELFIAGVSHEFRNPLNSMMGNIELMSLDVKDPKWREMLDTCKLCGDALLGLINNVLDVAKINAEKLELNIQPTSFYGLIEKVWNLSSISLREKGLSGTLYFQKNFPPYVETDAHRLTQILLNLVGNATKFTRDGFVKVIVSWHKDKEMEELRKPSPEYKDYVSNKAGRFSVVQRKISCSETSLGTCSVLVDEETTAPQSEDNRQIISQRTFSVKTLSSLNDIISYVSLNEYETQLSQKTGDKILAPRKESGVLKVEVIDTGCGIPELAMNRVFQAFSQADSSVTRRFGGTGLGLYITKQLIQKMGGEINVYSHENVGSSFSILLPTQTAVPKHFIELNNPEKPLSYQERKVKALVVDDIPLNQIVMVRYLTKLGVEADVASDGIEAVKKFKQNEPDYYSFITMDIQMPLMDGLTASKEIRKYEAEKRASKNVPIIMVTGNCTEVEKNFCLDPYGEIKASFFFRKPFVFDECKSCIDFLLGRDSVKEYRLNKTNFY